MSKEIIDNIFGDDGFRCKYGEKYLTKKFLTNFSKSLALHYKKKYKNPKCIIGIDTRNTGLKIYKIITKDKVLLRLDFVDGNRDNYEMSNLRLLCPNCFLSFNGWFPSAGNF